MGGKQSKSGEQTGEVNQSVPITQSMDKKSEPEETKNEEDDHLSKNVIVSIDFGSTFSGYALWIKGSRDILTKGTGKEPTYVYWNETESRFGNDAKDMLTKQESWDNAYLFRHFKMALYQKGSFSRDIKIKDINGKEVEAMTVFGKAIESMKNEALSHLKTVTLANDKTIYGEENIGWMITIPAISSDSARQFMREAALLAGIDANDVRLVLEPEAASLFCREKPYKLQRTGEMANLEEGHKYILADLGGGTVDICVHEILAEGKLRELYRATGDKAGGLKVDRTFEGFIVELVSRKVVETVLHQFRPTYEALLANFVLKKKQFSRTQDRTVLRLDLDVVETYEKEFGKSFSEVIGASPWKEQLLYQEHKDKLTLQQNVMQLFMDSSVDIILSQLDEVVQACTEYSISTLILVGGFSLSPYVRERIQEKFPNLALVLDDDAEVAVLKGAVLMGSKPKNVIQRRSRYTYGFGTASPFIEGVHPENQKRFRDGQAICDGIFDKVVKKGQMLSFGQTFTMTTTASMKRPNSKHITLPTWIWRSDHLDPTYCTEDEGCELAGKISISPPECGWPNHVEFLDQLIVGETEFTVKSFNKKTGEQYRAQIDFL